MSEEEEVHVMSSTAAESFQVRRELRKLVRRTTELVKNKYYVFLEKHWGRDWLGDLGPIEGKKGEIKRVQFDPQCLFFGQKIMAQDSFEQKGYGTRIGQILVGQRLQRPVGGESTLTAFFANNALGNGIKMSPCRRGEVIEFTIHFIEDCMWDGILFGRAVL